MSAKLEYYLNDRIDNTAFSIRRMHHELPEPLLKYVNSYFRRSYMEYFTKFQYSDNLLRLDHIEDVSMDASLDTTQTTEDISNYGYMMSLNEQETEVKVRNSLTINGVPNEFVNSFGNYIGLKFFLDGIKAHNDVYTILDKDISLSDYELINSMYNSKRVISSKNRIDYEYYDENFGYVVIQHNINDKDRYKIVCAIGYNALNDVISSCGKNIKHVPMASWVTGVDNYGDLEIKSFSIKEINEYKSEFYPFMKGEHIADFAERYVNSKSSILLLIGPPGTAKTNFIRQLLSCTNESVLLTYSDDLKKTDKLFSYFYDSPEKFLIIEDADTYIEKREDGNTNMKQLLNITDGLTANPDKKVIFSTNLPSLSRVEPALLRPGRCFERLEFDRLQSNDLKAAVNCIGAEYFKDLDYSKSYSIAELFAIKNNEQTDVVLTSSKFGFGS